MKSTLELLADTFEAKGKALHEASLLETNDLRSVLMKERAIAYKEACIDVWKVFNEQQLSKIN